MLTWWLVRSRLGEGTAYHGQTSDVTGVQRTCRVPGCIVSEPAVNQLNARRSLYNRLHNVKY